MSSADQKMLAKAIYIATIAHHNQYDRGGNAYILHPLAVMQNMKNHNFDIVTQCIAVLHDVLEDNREWTVERLLAEGMTTEVTDGLVLMCHEPGVDYFDYIARMKDNLRVMHAKRGDIEHNFDIRRLKGLRPKDIERLEKYSKAYVLINTMIENFETVERFKKEHL